MRIFSHTAVLIACLLAFAFATTPALAETPAPHGAHAKDDGHGHGKEDSHAKAGAKDDGHGHAKSDGHEAGGHADAGHGDAHGDGHGDEHGGHHFGVFTGDEDHDGTVNWMDSSNGAEAADPEVFQLKRLGFHFVNFLILAGLLFWFGRRPIADALATRALGIRKEIADSARLRDEAEQRNAELMSRLDKIESEIQGMHDKAVEEAQHEEETLVARAKAESERIKATAERSIRDEVTRARAALRADAVKLAVDLAENTLKDRVNADTQQRLAKDFLESIKQGGVNRV